MVHIPLLHDIFILAHKLFYQAQASYWRPNQRVYSPTDPILSDDSDTIDFAEEAHLIALNGMLRPATPIVVPVSPHSSDPESDHDTNGSDVATPEYSPAE